MKKGITWRRLSPARRKTLLPGTAEILKDEERQILNEMQKLHLKRKANPKRNELVRRGIATLSAEGKLRMRKLTKAETEKTTQILEEIWRLNSKAHRNFADLLFPERFKDITKDNWGATDRRAARNDFLFVFGKKAPAEAEHWLNLWKTAKHNYELVSQIAGERHLKLIETDIAHIAAKMAKEGKSPEYIERIMRTCGKELNDAVKAFGIY